MNLLKIDHCTRNCALYSLPKACQLFNLIQNLYMYVRVIRKDLNSLSSEIKYTRKPNQVQIYTSFHNFMEISQIFHYEDIFCEKL